MSVYPKQRLQVQFMTFGVEHHGISIPILRRDKESETHLTSATRPDSAQADPARASR